MQPKNDNFYAAVQEAYDRIRHEAQSSNPDLNSEACLSQFRRAVVDYNESPEALDLCHRIAESAFQSTFKNQARDSVVAFLSDHHGLTEEQGICCIVNDFLNYLVPRTIGLPNERQLFDRYYCELENALFTDRFHMTVTAVLRNVVDQDELLAFSQSLAREFPATNTGWRATISATNERFLGDLRPSLLTLLGAVERIKLES